MEALPEAPTLNMVNTGGHGVETHRNDSTPPTVTTSNASNSSCVNNQKVKPQHNPQQQQQQQPQQQQPPPQQQQVHQFRTPQQFVKQRRSAAALSNKKNKTWNKRQNKTGKQQQGGGGGNGNGNGNGNNVAQSALATQAAAGGTATGAGAGGVGAGGARGSNNIGSVTASSGGNCCALVGGQGQAQGHGHGHEHGHGQGQTQSQSNLPTTKADLENIQNFKNQLSGSGGGGGGGGGGSGGGGGHHYYYNNHHHHHHHNHGHHQGRGIALGNNLPSISTLANVEKLCYGHGHLKQQLYKKMMAHRGHHNHVLCAGSAHNTLGGVGSAACCLLHCCNGQSGKDIGSGGINSTSAANAANALHFCAGRAKFFLPDKRPRKEVIIPPTKFLLGGNISDPLNLNSLQNENSNTSSNNNTPATTPRQSPITTPPKVEVIIPPNIRDPLHLLDPVDSMEYEKQLTSPMKRGLCGLRGLSKHHKHRHRKNRKPKRRRFESYNSSTGAPDGSDDPTTTVLANSTVATEGAATAAAGVTSSLLLSISVDGDANNKSVSSGASAAGGGGGVSVSSGALVGAVGEAPAVDNNVNNSERENSKVVDSPLHSTAGVAAAATTTIIATAAATILSATERMERNTVGLSPPSLGSAAATETAVAVAPVVGGGAEAATVVGGVGSVSGSCGSVGVAAGVVGDTAVPRGGGGGGERGNIRDLRLELYSAASSTCGSVGSGIGSGSGGGGGGGRKRKISESNNSQKNKKFHRQDTMDKIVSPVVPQPGAWKRPPRIVATGARKPSRRSTSISETGELLSPAEEAAKLLLLEADIPHTTPDTPEVAKMELMSEIGLCSPLSTASIATSIAVGEEESTSLLDASVNDSSNSSALVPAGTDDTPRIAGTPAAVAAAAAMMMMKVQQLPASIAATTAFGEQAHKLPTFRPDGAKFRYGNYDCYAGYRYLNEFMDVRLQVFQQHTELFQNKDVLDIGCNVGHMTISVARNFAPKSILGVDIDKKLITRARLNLAKYVRIPLQDASIKKTDSPPITGGGVGASAGASAVAVAAGNCIKESPQAAATPAAPTTCTTDTSMTCHKKLRRKKKRKRNGTQNGVHHHHHHHPLLQHFINYHRQAQKQHLKVDAAELFPVSFPLIYGVIPTVRQLEDFASLSTTTTPGHPSTASCTNIVQSGATSPTSKSKSFPNNVFFRQLNYVLKDESLLCNDSQQYDLILCLSVTKWIHLNFGDNGLKLAFKRMFNQLRPGGKLILEAQNWASYKKKKNLTEDIYNNYRNIEFFPNKFHEYLLSTEVGFSHSYTLGVPRHLSKGFCRPIQLYAKGDFTPNHVRWSDAYYPQTPYEAYRGIYATMPPRPAVSHRLSSSRSQTYDTPHYTGNTSGPYSSRQTPMHQPTSQYYNPLESDSYQPSYDMDYLNHMYVFASPLYQTAWSPPASLRKSSSHTPLYGSVREAELDGEGSSSAGGGSYHRHVYPPNDDTSSPNASAGGAFNSIRDADTDDSNQMPADRRQHVYATNYGESSSSPQVNHHDSETIDGLMLDEELHVNGCAGNIGSGGSSYGDPNDT